MEQSFDVAIIGGGINGCGCAADAALRGLSVVLCEQNDIASQTSSKSTKLIHGGLRYLEYYDFAMVKRALDERQRLLNLAPHLVHPLSLFIPHQKNTRPLWLIRAGLFLYDHLSFSNTLPRSKLIKKRSHSPFFHPLDKQFATGFLYYDCTTDDARLTLANALQAKEHGAAILPQTKLIGAEIINKQWELRLQTPDSRLLHIRAKTVINTAGPWVDDVSQLLQIPMQHTMSLVKGSHIVVEKLYEGEHAYMLQNKDKRIVFVIPYYGYTLIGTTDVPFSGERSTVHIDQDEISYLLTIANSYFNKQLNESDIITTWSGIRPLLADEGKSPSALSRDYDYHYSERPAPAVTVYGGKITTYRQLALKAVNALSTIFPHLPPSATATTPLPGAIKDTMNFSAYVEHAKKQYHWLEHDILMRYLQTYGTRTDDILNGCHQMSDLGIYFGSTLYQQEVDYLRREEWAMHSEDILWRRTKLGLQMDSAGKKMLTDYLGGVYSEPL